MQVLLILGHPRQDSLCGALADAYQAGALRAGAQVRRLDLAALDFDPHVRTVSPTDQALEPDLVRARELLAWAEHLVFVYPGWWGTGPALLKGFLDRVILPGFAFRETEDGGFQGLLTGRTAHLITTQDMPGWVYRLVFRAPGHNAMKRSVLGFCGIRTTRILTLGPVKDSDARQRAAWLERARALGFSLARGALGPGRRLADKLRAWLAAIRLQFYPMTWLAYTVGALGAARGSGAGLDWDSYWPGYLFLLFLEVATVLSNEYHDYETDRANRSHGPFTGGSRVLVDGRLGFGEVRCGIVLALMAALGAAGVLAAVSPAPAAVLAVLIGAMLVLCLGYTAPPLKLAYRGLGEVDVSLTHSLGVLLCGYVFQGGAWWDGFPWLASVPLFLAVLPAIILAGIPDLEADRRAAKGTLAVRLGPRRAVDLAMVCVALAALTTLLWGERPGLYGSYQGAAVGVLPHAVLLLWLLGDYRRRCTAGRIDGLLVAALAYILWFGLVPFYRLA